MFHKKQFNKNALDLDGSDEEESPSLTVNKDYAQRYDQWRGKEELQKLKDRYGDIDDDDDGESSSASSSEEEWTEDQEKDFLKTFSLLKKKDPKIYDGHTHFFKKDEPKSQEDGAKNEEKPVGPKKQKKPEKITLKDHERKMILEKGGLESDEETEIANVDDDPSYVQAQANIKKGFRDALNAIESDEEGDDYSKSDLLVKKEMKASDKEQEDEDYRKWLKGEVERLKSKDGAVQEMSFLKEYWNDPNLDEGEKFLRDYILNRKYMDPVENSKIPSYDEIVRGSDEEDLQADETALEQMEQFEHKFNFRFEEPDQDFIKRYPRTIASSLRRPDEKLKRHRESVKERKEAEKQKKKDEIQRLKALKKQEILNKIKQVQESLGNPDVEIEEDVIEGDFDPDEHDRKMKAIFDEQYYGEEEEEKPVFPFDEEIDGDLADIEPYLPSEDENASLSDGEQENESEDPKPSTSTAADAKKSRATELMNEIIESTKKRRHGKKKSAFLEALERSKPAFDPKVHGSFEKYFEDYYNLHYEDIVGDLPCRFKYRQVPANDFGLTVDEILKAPDRELNQWASLKKTYQYRSAEEERQDLLTYKNKSTNIRHKQKVLTSLFKTSDDEDDGKAGPSSETRTNESRGQDEAQPDAKSKSKKKKKKKKNKPKSNVPESSGAAKEDNKDSKPITSAIEASKTSDTVHQNGTDEKPKKKKRRKGKVNNTDANSAPPEPQAEQPSKESSVDKKISNGKRKSDKQGHHNHKKFKSNSNDNSIADERLLAYGINPNKFRKQQKYGSKKVEF